MFFFFVFFLLEHGDVLQTLSSSGLLQLALDLLKDPESYVRASAVTCMGQIANIAYVNPTSAFSSILSIEALKKEVSVSEYYFFLIFYLE